VSGIDFSVMKERFSKLLSLGTFLAMMENLFLKALPLLSG